MNIGVHKIEYKDSREFSTELEFIIACDRVSGKELINISLINTEKITSFKNFITRHLKSMKRD